MITEDYVSFETAKLLKEKGFDAKCNRYYNAQYEEARTVSDTFAMNFNDETLVRRLMMEGAYSIPTLQMAMKWLRNKHNCHIIIDYTFTGDANLSEEYVSYCYKVENAKTYMQHIHNEWYSTYEQACEAAIKYCLTELV
jgi:hypothetical protein